MHERNQSASFTRDYSIFERPYVPAPGDEPHDRPILAPLAVGGTDEEINLRVTITLSARKRDLLGRPMRPHATVRIVDEEGTPNVVQVGWYAESVKDLGDLVHGLLREALDNMREERRWAPCWNCDGGGCRVCDGHGAVKAERVW